MPTRSIRLPVLYDVIAAMLLASCVGQGDLPFFAADAPCHHGSGNIGFDSPSPVSAAPPGPR